MIYRRMAEEAGGTTYISDCRGSQKTYCWIRKNPVQTSIYWFKSFVRKMNSTDAKSALLRHACHSDVPATADGFLGSLRPYRGSLVSENYHEVMSALKALASELSAPTVDREIVAALWDICFLSRDWLHPDGMLGRNKLLSDSDTEILTEWIDDISYAMMVLLGGGLFADAFHPYETRRNGA